MDVLLITDENKSHYMYIQNLTDLCARTNNKKHFSKYCLQCFTSFTCLKVNGKQTVKLKSGSINFKNHFKQSAVSFKIHAGFESILNQF